MPGYPMDSGLESRMLNFCVANWPVIPVLAVIYHRSRSVMNLDPLFLSEIKGFLLRGLNYRHLDVDQWGYMMLSILLCFKGRRMHIHVHEGS